MPSDPSREATGSNPGGDIHILPGANVHQVKSGGTDHHYHGTILITLVDDKGRELERITLEKKIKLEGERNRDLMIKAVEDAVKADGELTRATITEEGRLTRDDVEKNTPNLREAKSGWSRR